MEKENQPLQENTQITPSPNSKSINWFLIGLGVLLLFSFASTGFLFYQNTQFKKQINQLKESSSSTFLVSPMPIGETEEKPLIAYRKEQVINAMEASVDNTKDQLLLYNPNLESTKELAQGDIILFKWTKDGQWLYWYIENKKESKVTFFRGKYPNFEAEKFLEIETLSPNDIFDFFPLQQTNQLLISQKDGLYLYTDFQNLKALSKKQLLKTESLEGFSDPQITNTYSVLDVSHSEEYAILENTGWEGILDTGIFNIKNIFYQVIPETQNTFITTAAFSPNDKYVLVAGPVSAMDGSDTKEVIYHFPSLEPYRNINEMIGAEIGGADFLSDSLAVFSVNLGAVFSDEIKRVGLAIVDFVNEKEIKFIEYPIKTKKEDIFIYNYEVDVSDNLLVFKDIKSSEAGYFFYDLENNKVIERKIFDKNIPYSFELEPQPKAFKN